MKRDMDLIREILLSLEAWNPDNPPFTPQIMPDRNPVEASYHIGLLTEAGLLDGRSHGGLQKPTDLVAILLTWGGHEFLEAAKKKVWEKAKKIIAEKGGGLTFDALRQLLLKLLSNLVSS